jgi:hypothetical protein
MRANQEIIVKAVLPVDYVCIGYGLRKRRVYSFARAHADLEFVRYNNRAVFGTYAATGASVFVNVTGMFLHDSPKITGTSAKPG